jgi:multiple sugar transport system permease protein
LATSTFQSFFAFERINHQTAQRMNNLRKSLRHQVNSIRRAAYFFLAPALIPILVFFFLPALAAFILSFTDFDIYSLSNYQYVRFVALKNYFQLLDDPLFWKVMVNTFYYVLVGGPLSIAASLATALLLNSKLVRFKGLFRTVYFAPVVTTLVAVAVVWRFLYHPRFGLLNYALSFFGIDPIDWLGDPVWAMPAIILMSVWKGFGYNMIIFIAGLQNIPAQLYEAARMDGANTWQQFKDITLPMLAPTTIFVSIIVMIGNFQLFTEPYVMTQGGPVNSTLSIVLLMYQQGFRWWNLGYSAAIAFVLFGVILLGSLLQAKLQKRGETS